MRSSASWWRSIFRNTSATSFHVGLLSWFRSQWSITSTRHWLSGWSEYLSMTSLAIPTANPNWYHLGVTWDFSWISSMSKLMFVSSCLLSSWESSCLLWIAEWFISAYWILSSKIVHSWVPNGTKSDLAVGQMSAYMHPCCWMLCKQHILAYIPCWHYVSTSMTLLILLQPLLHIVKLLCCFGQLLYACRHVTQKASYNSAAALQHYVSIILAMYVMGEYF